jgi:hypothetical protein
MSVLAALLSGPVFGQNAAAGRPVAADVRAPAAVAQALVDAFNAHDVEGVLAVYAPDCVARRLPGGEEFLRGKAAVRAKFVALFEKNPRVRIEIVGRIAHGSYVIDREKITGVAGGEGPSFGVVIYEIEDGSIRNEWYLPKTSTPD